MNNGLDLCDNCNQREAKHIEQDKEHSEKLEDNYCTCINGGWMLKDGVDTCPTCKKPINPKDTPSEILKRIADNGLSSVEQQHNKAIDVLIDVYGCKDLDDLKRCFMSNDLSLTMILEAMEQHHMIQKRIEEEARLI